MTCLSGSHKQQKGKNVFNANEEMGGEATCVGVPNHQYVMRKPCAVPSFCLGPLWIVILGTCQVLCHYEAAASDQRPLATPQRRIGLSGLLATWQVYHLRKTDLVPGQWEELPHMQNSHRECRVQQMHSLIETGCSAECQTPSGDRALLVCRCERRPVTPSYVSRHHTKPFATVWCSD